MNNDDLSQIEVDNFKNTLIEYQINKQQWNLPKGRISSPFVIDVDQNATIGMIHFEGCIFDDIFSINSQGVKSSYYFSNCKFSKIVNIYQSRFHSNAYSQRWRYYSVYFIDCTFEEPLQISGCSFSSGIYFGKCSFLQDVSFTGCTVATENMFPRDYTTFTIQESKSIEGILKFDNVDIDASFIFNKNKQTKDIRANQLKARNFDLLENDCDGIFFFDNIFSENNIMIQKTKFSKQFSFNFLKKLETHENLDPDKIRRLELNENVFSAAATFAFIIPYPANTFKDPSYEVATGPKKIFIRSCVASEVLAFIGGEPGSAKFQLSELDIRLSTSLSGQLRISSFEVQNMNLQGDNSLKILNLDNILFGSITFKNVTNSNQIRLVNCSGNSGSVLSVIDSDLGKTSFLGFDFNGFSTIKVFNSIISEIITSNVNWFNKEKLFVDEKKEETVQYLSRERETYRQLKSSTEKHQDKVQSLVFHSYELDCLKAISKLDPSMSHGDRWSLRLGKTNDFGINWLKPLLLGFSGTVFFWLLIVGLADNTWPCKICYNPCLIDAFYGYMEKLNLLFEMLNPISKYELPFASNVLRKSLISLLSYLQRIGISFFIYQIIVAFRKFVKN